MSRRTVVLLSSVAVAVLALLVVPRVLANVLVDYWWFRSLGYGSVYTKVLWAKIGLWWLGFAVAFGGAALGIVCARRRMGPERVAFVRFGTLVMPAPSLRRYAMILCWGIAFLAGLVGGTSATALWHRVLLFLNQAPFGVSDPILGNDVGFYAFAYPLARALHPLLQALAWLSLGISTLLYVSAGAFAVGRVGAFPRRPFAHLSRMVGVIFLLTGLGYLLNRYGLLCSTEGVTFGAGYADIKSRLPAYWIMFAASLAAAGMFFTASSPAHLKRLAVTIAAWAGCALVFVGLLPPLLQALRVEPNELELEKPYIRNTIEGTLQAYGLSGIDEVQYPVKEGLTYEAVQAESGTVSNVRLWDKGPLYETYREKQGIRTYYDFGGVSEDRYDLARGTTQVMLSVRELRHEGSQTWVNKRLQYTHGYGLCASPVNDYTQQGLPVLLVRDIPPVAPPEMAVDRPEIYYGLGPSDYAFVNTQAEEFDYPAGEENRYTRYEGKGGVPVAGLLRKLLFAVRLRDFKILLSDDLTEGSRVLYHRDVAERVHRIAPYLMLDRDPYAVVHGGRVYWIQDAYTTSRFYPYSEPVAGGGLNYIRNSVKAVMDAYEGSVTFYVSDDSDPFIQAYRKMFPSLYRPISDMPAGLRRHVRYPRDLFDVQADKLRAYHMRDARVFYNKEDLWEVPLEMYRGQRRPVQSYYVTMRLPEGDRPEFILMLPFTPRGKQNMIAWLAARCDVEHYGELAVFMFPKGKLIYGPFQVEALIDQEPDISQQLTLWSQSGSQVTRGNLLVIPVAGGILYVEPLYIQAEAGALPQLKRVIAASGDRVAMAEDLEGALAAVFQAPEGAAPSVEPQPPPATGVEPRARALLTEAMEHFRHAQEALKEADWEAYGVHMRAMKEALDRLDGALAGAEAP